MNEKECRAGGETAHRMGVGSSMRYTIRTIWNADKGCILLSFYKNCTEEVYMSFFFILMLQMIYSYIENGKPFMGLLRFVALFCLGHIGIHLVSAWHAYYIRKKTPRVYAYIFNKVIDKAVRIELTKYEQPDFYDRFARALDECLTKAMDGLNALAWATGCALSAVAAMFLIARVDPVILVFSLPSIVASFIFSSRINTLRYELRTQETRDKRTAEYVKRVFYEKKYAGEIRLYDIRKVLMREHKDSYDSRYELYVRMYRRIHMLRQLQELVIFVLPILLAYIYVSVVLKTTGEAKIGLYVATLGSIDYFAWRVKMAIRNYMEAGKNCMYMNNLQQFLEMDEETVESGKRKVDQPLGDIVLDHVSFRYNGSDRETIHDLSLHIRKGERIALVGENGAGKTTLVKLLMGLYPIREGKITVDGVDIQEYDKRDYQKHFGTVFQDLQIFSLPLSHNVLMKEPENEEERALVVEALEKAQFADVLEKLPDGIDSMVTKEFDDKGFICSGGQAQKIAIARVFAKKPDIVILDEPSSALDPIAEFNMYNNMLEASDGRTVFFISHRLSSARIADRIYFLEHGRIVEQGSHDELMQLDGKYAEMFRLQARNYKDRGEVYAYES